MKPLVTIAVSVGSTALALGVLLYCCPEASAAAPESASRGAFYCDQEALDPVRRKRHFEVLIPELVAQRTAVRELADGYEFEFPSVFFPHLVEWMDGERKCCPFFDFALRVAPERGPLTVRVTGKPGTKDFIRMDAAKWIEPVLQRRAY